MHELPRTIPDVRMLLALAPEELAATILFLLKKRNEAKFHTGNLQRELWHIPQPVSRNIRGSTKMKSISHCRKRGRGSRRRDLSFWIWRTGSTGGSC
jgi:hypothetical protein